jgi:hypothetical protein
VNEGCHPADEEFLKKNNELGTVKNSNRSVQRLNAYPMLLRERIVARVQLNPPMLQLLRHQPP